MNKTERNRFTKFLWAICLVLVMVLCHTPQAYAASPDVEASNYSEFVSAVIAAQDGDVISITGVIDIPPAVSFGSDTLHVTLQRANAAAFINLPYADGVIDTLLNGMTFDGANIPSTVEFVSIYHNTTFQDVTFKNCISSASSGAANVGNGMATFNNCTFDNNTATNGGHLTVNGMATVHIENSTMKNGIATSKGGAILIASTASTCNITSSTITGNSADNLGGGIYNSGVLTITDSKIFKNTASNGGSDIANDEFGTLTLEQDQEVLQALFDDENIIVKGWMSDFTDESGGSFLRLDFELPAPTPEPIPDPEPVTPPSSNHSSGGSSHSTYTPTVTPTVPVVVKTPVALSAGKAVLDTTRTEYLLGYTDALMGNQGTVTRSQLAQIVYRLLTPESKAAVYSEKNSFKDVASNAWYNEAVSSMANAGLISVGTDGKFNPDKNVTWGEMVSILVKFAKPNTEWKIITKHWARDSINTAISYRWFNYTDEFKPDGEVTRVEMLNFINAMFTWTKQ